MASTQIKKQDSVRRPDTTTLEPTPSHERLPPKSSHADSGLMPEMSEACFYALNTWGHRAFAFFHPDSSRLLGAAVDCAI